MADVVVTRTRSIAIFSLCCGLSLYAVKARAKGFKWTATSTTSIAITGNIVAAKPISLDENRIDPWRVQREYVGDACRIESPSYTLSASEPPSRCKVR
jgi:hypothetical protein